MLVCATTPAAKLLHSLHLAHNQPPSQTALSADLLKIIADAEAAASDACPTEKFSDAQKGPLYDRAATDGELLEGGVETLLGAMRASKDAVFADLGSGRGGAMFRIAAGSEWRHCFGIEFIESKHAAAEHALGSLRSSSVLRSPVTFMPGDIVELDALAATVVGEPLDSDGGQSSGESGEQAGTGTTRLSELTHAFACSVCFDDFLLRAMARSLGNRTAFPRFQALVSLRSLPSQPYLTRVGGIALECSWNAQVTGHVYVPSDVLERDEGDRAVPLLAHCLCEGGVCSLPAPLQPWIAPRYVRIPR